MLIQAISFKIGFKLAVRTLLFSKRISFSCIEQELERNKTIHYIPIVRILMETLVFCHKFYQMHQGKISKKQSIKISKNQ